MIFPIVCKKITSHQYVHKFVPQIALTLPEQGSLGAER